MLSLRYEGWLQCRLATDPDPSDEPRGVSGWTFAVAGEPDLDRIIRPQPQDAVERPCGPRVGVTVRTASVFGQEDGEHPLVGAAVELLDDPVFEGRNGIAAEDAQEPIFPFHVRIANDGIIMRRAHRDLRTGNFASDPPVGFGAPGEEVAAAIDNLEPVEFRKRRQSALEDAHSATDDAVAQVALQKRISDIERGLMEIERRRGDIATSSLGFALSYRIVMEGPWVEVRDPDDALGGILDSSPWIASFWVGAWDADALCAYMKGQLDVPFQPA